ncbi:MAG: LodA/GoxA family CTQ-dependent oxidase, partial [Solirubrobacteraceae bacterium]
RHGHPSLTSYAGNDGWADDVCDGLIRATVRLGRRRLEADAAWVITTPPNYAPGMATGWSRSTTPYGRCSCRAALSTRRR